jgi:threonylcarbamoyladenosine tRNA methylthiotransferase MtaB
VKYSVVTFGCRVNQADSLAIEGELLAHGGVAVPPDEADLVVVNTCSVTATADQGARQTVRRVVRANPAVRVIVTGCYATRAPEEVACLPNVAHVVPNSRKESLVDVIADAAKTMSTVERFSSGDGPCGSRLEPGVAGRTAFTLRVQTGCDERCSYCIIPTTRGPGRSKPVDDVIDDVRRAIAAGYKEVALTGVHLGSYGRDLPRPSSLATLLGALADWPDDVLFRVSSLEPMDCTPDVVALVASTKRFAPHFHLPLQHGADSMLRAMRRPYTAAYYTALVGRIAALMPHASIGSDVIVGFPGETEAQFAESVTVLRDLPLSHLHVFPYSDRPGTEASALQPKGDGVLIRERGRQIRELGAAMTRRFRAAQAGTVRRALVVDDGWSAVTDNYLKVRLERQTPRNTWVDVTLFH